MGSNLNNRPAIGTSFSKGSIDASLEANFPSLPVIGDTYDISVAGSFENSALVIPVNAYFDPPDKVRWNGENWVKEESGNNVSDEVFGVSWDGNVNNAPSKNAVYDEVIKKVNILDSTTAGFGFVIDEDTLASNLDTKVPTQQSVKAYADAKVNDTAFDASWDGIVNNAPSKNAVYDALNPHITSTTAHGISTFGSSLVDDADADTARSTLGLGAMALEAKTITTEGDLLVGGTAGALARLGIGTNGQVLTLAAGAPAWDGVLLTVANSDKLNQQDATKTVSTQTYTFLDTDHGKTIFFDYAGAVTITCPQSLTSTVHVTCVAEGATTTLAFVAGGTATFVSKDSKTTVTARYGVATLVHKGGNAWFGFGNLE